MYSLLEAKMEKFNYESEKRLNNIKLIYQSSELTDTYRELLIKLVKSYMSGNLISKLDNNYYSCISQDKNTEVFLKIDGDNWAQGFENFENPDLVDFFKSYIKDIIKTFITEKDISILDSRVELRFVEFIKYFKELQSHNINDLDDAPILFNYPEGTKRECANCGKLHDIDAEICECGCGALYPLIDMDKVDWTTGESIEDAYKGTKEFMESRYRRMSDK